MSALLSGSRRTTCTKTGIESQSYLGQAGRPPTRSIISCEYQPTNLYGGTVQQPRTHQRSVLAPTDALRKNDFQNSTKPAPLTLRHVLRTGDGLRPMLTSKNSTSVPLE